MRRQVLSRWFGIMLIADWNQHDSGLESCCLRRPVLSRWIGAVRFTSCTAHARSREFEVKHAACIERTRLMCVHTCDGFLVISGARTLGALYFSLGLM